MPEQWNSILDANARFRKQLTEDERARVDGSIRVMVAEKNWEGCGGLKLTDEHRVTIAAQIARLTLHFLDEYFDDVLSILVYPDAYVGKSSHSLGGGVVVEQDSGRLGEAWYRGPVILSWRDILASVRAVRPTRNVIIHEFAHQLDMRNGSFADGIPAIESPATAQNWLNIMPRSLEVLQRICMQGMPCVLDCYGATNQAEFFAVASESYFEQPQELSQQWPQVFSLLDEFYRNRSARIS